MVTNHHFRILSVAAFVVQMVNGKFSSEVRAIEKWLNDVSEIHSKEWETRITGRVSDCKFATPDEEAAFFKSHLEITPGFKRNVSAYMIDESREWRNCHKRTLHLQVNEFVVKKKKKGENDVFHCEYDGKKAVLKRCTKKEIATHMYLLHHDSCLPLLGIIPGPHPETPMMLMRFIECLDSFVRTNKITREECLQMIKDCLVVVHDFLSEGIYHDDVGIDNFFIGTHPSTGRPEIYLGDFEWCTSDLDDDVSEAKASALNYLGAVGLFQNDKHTTKLPEKFKEQYKVFVSKCNDFAERTPESFLEIVNTFLNGKCVADLEEAFCKAIYN